MTLELYPASAHDAFHGTGLQFPQCVDEAVQQIHGACQGLGTDEKTLITVLGSKSPETRNLIALRYKELYHKPLKDLVKSETSGDFGRLLRMISTPLSETEAQILRDATKGMGTTESLIIQILSGRSNEEMNILKRTYFDLVGKDLAVTMNSELSGDFRKVVMAVLQSPQVLYNPAVHNAANAEEEATALYKAGQGRLGTNEEAFIGILVKAPPELLKMMDAVYVAKYNNNIAKAVDKEFSGDAKKSLNYLVRSIMDPYPAIAEVFEKTMKGFGTDETGLSTALVRYQSVLPYVKAAYKKLYREELRDRISGETSGDYKRLLMEVFDAPQDPPKTKGVKGAHGAAASSGVGVSQPSQGILHNSQDTLRSNTHLLDSLSRTEVHLRLKVAILRLVATSINILPPVDTLRTEDGLPTELRMNEDGSFAQYVPTTLCYDHNSWLYKIQNVEGLLRTSAEDIITYQRERRDRYFDHGHIQDLLTLLLEELKD
ncbi:hypothetical protein BBJ29_003127 [Phytophthora kernoviae]|uniref:Annexin n=1 Tax=Phytophthora kernoviae TaxID=325452 RepID=A0A3F2RTH7_9STRA|nr:hypothetical protein BBJ29_003127 [Phytophthora kernoviae]RLN63884.1 hypothetical protein BBP00_00003815 [Phytophthora kernoviae]